MKHPPIYAYTSELSYRVVEPSEATFTGTPNALRLRKNHVGFVVPVMLIGVRSVGSDKDDEERSRGLLLYIALELPEASRRW